MLLTRGVEHEECRGLSLKEAMVGVCIYIYICIASAIEERCVGHRKGGRKQVVAEEGGLRMNIYICVCVCMPW